jgi:hypothetical protein
MRAKHGMGGQAAVMNSEPSSTSRQGRSGPTALEQTKSRKQKEPHELPETTFLKKENNALTMHVEAMVLDEVGDAVEEIGRVLDAHIAHHHLLDQHVVYLVPMLERESWHQ